ncbi:MAG TPA: hypothetical protein VMF52_22095 [Steroidobacteraceae bacterium]|nr:hypothetical protein [Steroidobacteraceae bacterium]
MKRPALFLATLALAITSSAWADAPKGPPPGGPRGGPPIERLAQDLGLDANQTTQVKAILDAQHAKMDAERAQFESSGTRPSREEMHAKHEQMDAELDTQLAGVLTPEQLAKFKEMRKHRPMGPPPGGAPAGQGQGSQGQ